MSKIILFVTEACNLRCRYCYQVNSGSQKNAFMQKDNAKEIARRLFSSGVPCNFVQFFGGEPTLNIPAIRSFVDEMSRTVEEGALAGRPQMGIVTNGASRYSQDLLVFCKEHDISVTVSIDGPKDIHDALRPGRGGVSTYEDVVRAISYLLDAQLHVAANPTLATLHPAGKPLSRQMIRRPQALDFNH